MHRNRGIRIGFKLCPQRGMLRGRNGTPPPRGALRRQVALRFAHGDKAFDGGQTDAKGCSDVGTSHAAINSGEYPLAKIHRIRFHTKYNQEYYLAFEPIMEQTVLRGSVAK